MNKQEIADNYIHHSEMFLTELFGQPVKLTLEFRDKMPLTHSKIIDICAGQNLVSREELLGTGRHRSKVNARKMVAAMMLKDSKNTLHLIGKQLGGKDHSTIIHYKREHEALMETDQDYRETFKKIEKVFA